MNYKQVEKNCPYREKIDKRPCKYYIKGGFCSRSDQYRCIEYIKRFEIPVSYSSLKAFWRCPYSYYLSTIKGIEVKEEYLPTAMLMGKYLHKAIETGILPENMYLDDHKIEALEAIIKAIDELGLIPDNWKYEVEFNTSEPDMPHIHGFIDTMNNDNSAIGEFKFTSRPDIYSNNFLAWEQLEAYFLASKNIQTAWLLPIRVPSLRSMKDEPEKYGNRVYQDILKRPAFYFPAYNEEKKPFKWGSCFWRDEFDLEKVKENYHISAMEIRRCAKLGKWMQNRSNCLFPTECQYLNICELGTVNEQIYEFRKKEVKDENL